MSKSTKTLSITEYAKEVRKSRQAVLKSVKCYLDDKEKGSLRLLPGVKKIERIGHVYALTVSASFNFSES